MLRLFLLLALSLLASPLLAQDNPMVLMHTTAGDIRIELYPEQAPQTVANFLDYVRSDFYDGTIFHRVIPGFVIQGGGFTAQYQHKPTQPPIENEADNGLTNERGTLSMARTSDPDSATSQFFINLSDNPPLNQAPGHPGYAVFGKVVEGMDVVDEIAAEPTGAAGPFRQDAPQQTMIIEDAEVVNASD